MERSSAPDFELLWELEVLLPLHAGGGKCRRVRGVYCYANVSHTAFAVSLDSYYVTRASERLSKGAASTGILTGPI